MKTINNYDDYQDYVDHQKEKTLDPVRRKTWTTKEWDMKIRMFTKIFERHSDFVKGDALCICARMGQEIVALRNLGINAVGIDLVPYPPLVEEGDMHNLKYEDNSFDFIFSNSFDHSLEPQKMISEIERVLRPNGHAILQLQFNVADNYAENKLANSKAVEALFKSSDVVVSQKIPKTDFPTYHWEVVVKKC